MSAMKLTDWMSSNRGVTRAVRGAPQGLIGAMLIGALLALYVVALAEAEAPSQQKKIGPTVYTVRLLAEDRFDNLKNWMVETPGAVTLRNNILRVEAVGSYGTVWNKTSIKGPTIVEYEARAFAGFRNINLIAYGSIVKDGREQLLETSSQRTGNPRDYGVFPNYFINYLSHEVGTWRTRFRKDPGYKLMTERFLSKTVPLEDFQHIAYVFGPDGEMSLYVDDELILSTTDPAAYRRGYHGLRTYNTNIEYKNFKMYQLLSSEPAPTPLAAPTGFRLEPSK